MEDRYDDNLEKIIASALFALSKEQFNKMLSGFVEENRITKEDKDNYMAEYMEKENHESDDIANIIADAALVLSTDEFTELMKEFSSIDLNDDVQKDSFVRKFGLGEESNFS